MSGINQKEYLKKYLGIGKGHSEKKKKKKPKKLGSGLKIVDDDVDIRLNEEIQVDLTADNDEAPQIVSVIDDRPPSLRIDEATHSKLWKPIGAPDDSEQVEGSIKFEGNIRLSKLGSKHSLLQDKRVPSLSRKHPGSKRDSKKNLSSVHEELSSSSSQVSSKPDKNNIKSPEQDFSPVRQHSSRDILPPRKEKTQPDSDSDNSPPRKKHTDLLKERVRNGDSDNSPPRKRSNSDGTSPPRRRKKDMSPRRVNIDQDSSPPRRSNTKTKGLSSPMKKGHTDEDSSPLRMIKRERSKDISPPRKRRGSEGDSSPPRRLKREKTEDNSPPRRGKGEESNSSSPRRSKRDKEDNSPPRKQKERSPGRKKSRWGKSEETSEKMDKTLDGKVAGLQSAAALVKETEELKKRDDALFKKLSAEVSGANATTIVRKKNKEVDLEEEERKRKIEEENKEKYNRWGKGLKQVDDVNERIKNDLYEMSKPLARYADDEDLEKHLKDQEREGDPMLAYIRQKKRKNIVDLGAPAIQQYEGDAPPNRFGIRPGYRWDGVDRSSGYEKKWFEVQNSRKASMEENYKWSTEDM